MAELLTPKKAVEKELSQVQAIKAMGQELGYVGDDLDTYTRKAMVEFQKEEREARVANRELARSLQVIEKQKLQQKHEPDKLAIEKQKLDQRHELDRLALELQLKENSEQNKVFMPSTKLPKLPDFKEGDDMDGFVRRFEIFAINSKWPGNMWGVAFSALLSGRALAIYHTLDIEQTQNWDKVKLNILKAYNLTEEGYREKFREARPTKFETATQFVVRLRSHFDRWVELTGKERTFDDLSDLILREQYYNTCSSDMVAFLREHPGANLDRLAELADLHTESRNYHRPHTGTHKQINKQTDKTGISRFSSSQTSKTTYHRCGRTGHKKKEFHARSDV